MVVTITFDFTMGRMVFACFPSLIPKERPSSTNFDEAVELLTSSASIDLRKLQTSLFKDAISLKWCCESIHFLKIMHSHFILLSESSDTARSWEGVNCLDLYMEETLALLDLCNWLKSAIFGMDRYRLIVDFSVKRLYDHELPDANFKFEVDSLEKESRKLYGVERWKDMNISKNCSLKMEARDRHVHVIYVIKTIIDVISRLLFSVIFYPLSVKVDQEVFYLLPRQKSASKTLQNLAFALSKRLHGSKDDSRPVLVEFKMIEREILDIKAEMFKGDAMEDRKLQRSINLLQSNSVALRDSLQLFENSVNELFEEVIKGRNRLLAMLRTN